MLGFSQAAQVVLALTAWLSPEGSSTHPHHSHTLLPHDLVKTLDRYRSNYGVRGVSLSVVTSPAFTGREWHEEVYSFGEADHKGNKVTSDSVFSIASNSKLFTYLAIGMLVENRTQLQNGAILDWATKVKDILPDWGLMDTYMSDHVNLIDLLSMRSGMPRHDGATPRERMPVGDILRKMRHMRPSAEIREHWQYNNLHYMTLSHIVTTLSGTLFRDYVKAHIFDPLGLTATYNVTQAGLAGTRTDGFTHVKRNETFCAEQWSHGRKLDAECLGGTEPLGWFMTEDTMFNDGAGGVQISGKDMAKWCRELLDPKVIPKTLLDKRQLGQGGVDSPSQFDEISHGTYGLAQQTYTYRGHRVVTHTGGVPGQSSRLIVMPDRGIAIFFVMNDSGPGIHLINTFPYAVFDHLLGLEPIDWDKRYGDEFLSKPPILPDIPANPEPPVQGIEGSYEDAAYGSFQLSSALDRSASLGLVRDLVHGQTPQRVNSSIEYVVPMPQTFQTHVVFSHWSGELWNWTSVNTYCPTIGGRAKCTGEVMSQGRAVMNGHGIGMYDFWGAGGTVPHRELDLNSVEQHAEVWFKRL